MFFAKRYTAVLAVLICSMLCFPQAFAQSDKSFREELNEAFDLSRQGKFDESLILLEELEKKAKNDNDLSSVISQRASTFERRFELKKALATYERLNALTKDKEKLKYSFSRSERSITKLKGKIARLEAALQESMDQEGMQSDPNEKIAIRAERSSTYMKLGRFDDAVGVSLEGIASYKERGVKPPKEWYLNAIASLFAQQKLQDAVNQAEVYYADYPTNANKGLVGLFKSRAGDTDGAWEILDELFVSGKMSEDLVLSGFYALAIKQEEYAKAVEVFERAQGLGLATSGLLVSKYPRASIMKAMSESKQYQKLVDFVAKKESKYGPTVQERLYLAKAHNALGDHKKAEKMIKKNLRVLAAVHHSELYTDLANSYLGQGKLKKALKTAKRAVKQDQENLEAQTLQAEIESRLEK